MNALEGKPNRGRNGPLSNREREVFALLAEGLSGAEIAERLVLSPETVRTHIRNAMGKLGASTRSQAVVMALGRREIAPPEDGETPPPTPPAVTPASEPADQGALSDSLGHVVEGLMSLWDVDAGWVYLADDAGLGLRQMVQRVDEPGSALPTNIALGEGAIGRAALERRAQILQAPGADAGAMIVTPLLEAGRLIGVLALAIRSSRATGRQELLLLQALGGRIAELIGTREPAVGERIDEALAGFRTSWASATRPL
jgi:DNA-binding CsgD family transcriptional regulator